MMGAIALRMMCRQMMPQSDTPMQRAASTYVSSRRVSTVLRTRRMKEGMVPTPTEIMTFCKPTPSTATRERANRMLGNENNVSATRCTTMSIQPP